MAKIRVLVADDHAVLRSGLRLMINTQSDLEVVGEAGTYDETLDAVRRILPDVVTVDLSMPGGSGIKLVETLARDYPRVRSLVLTMHDDPAYFRLALAAGAAGYVVKKAADTELLTAIRTVAAGRSYAHFELNGENRRLTPAVVPPRREGAGSALADLSEREREVFLQIARGHTNQAIADQLFLSVKTVESYRSRLMSKLGLQSRAELTQLALEIGLLDSNAPEASA